MKGVSKMSAPAEELLALAKKVYGHAAEVRPVKKTLSSGDSVDIPDSFEVFVEGTKIHDIASYSATSRAMLRVLARQG